ncbi:phage tail sheath C-terminal domain-containing protein [Paenibacillus aquistagni]|uniref:Phage tail sheath protein n=1 Tax=Paenibacillus aquistagni TaxID=1852522 RepID=A0A1X7LY37_9BACL|nr:phage tail sheath C-terminal domain-containing protein [Paenibacillus aquistagni]NMM52152.1 phage tail sheath protein [Paenibacillus aquistagni]SMG58203.1 Phage tail sheath protein [Paenibacillus aquistagni]
MAIGLPQIEITFSSLARTAVQRSARGIVALIVKDDTDTSFSVKEYKLASEVEKAAFTAENVKYIQDVLGGGASKVIVARVSVDSTEATEEAIQAIGKKKYNWIGHATGAAAEHTSLAAYVKEQEKTGKNIKAIVYKATNPDSMCVVNFTNETLTKIDDSEIAGDKYIARLLGLLAGLPMTQSGTYKVLEDLKSVKEPADLEAAVNNGELVLFNDDDQVRVARAVNSLQTLGEGVTEDMKKIIVVETMHLIREDIYTTFKQDYLGKYKNKYDNQILFISAVNTYFDALEREEILDSEYDNRSDIDVEEQRQAWIDIGKTEASDWDDSKVRINTFRSNVFLAGSIKILDAIEDLKFGITMQ